jgi:DNA repair protein RecO (recombination protein O)
LLAKGAYRPTSRVYGAIDLFDTLHLTWRVRPSSELGLVVQADVVTRRRRITADLTRYRAALAALDLARLVAREECAEPRLFADLVGLLDALDTETVDPETARVAHELRLLEGLGLSPALRRCASCGEQRQSRGRVPFSALAGGRLCARCADEERHAGREPELVEVADLRVAESLRTTPAAMLTRIHVDEQRLAGVDRLVARFLEVHLESRPGGRPRLSESRPRAGGRPRPARQQR